MYDNIGILRAVTVFMPSYNIIIQYLCQLILFEKLGLKK